MPPQKRLVTPKVYEAGVDVSQETLNELIPKLALWFVESRPSVKDPTALARQRVKDCLEGKTSEGQPWFSAANSTFASRIKMSCRFNMESENPAEWGGILQASEIQKKRKLKEKQREEKKTAKERAKEQREDTSDLTAALVHGATYAENAATFRSPAEFARWQEIKKGYQEQHPELRLVAAEAELNKLCNLLIMDERQQASMLTGAKDALDFEDMKRVTDMILGLKKGLGIHPDQIQKRKEEKVGGSFGELVARLESMPDAKELRESYMAERFIQFWQMYNSPSPRSDMEGYQLDKYGLWALTRCRSCHCPNCGQLNALGFSVDEIKDYLTGNGYLEIDENPIDTLLSEAREGVAIDETTGEPIEAPSTPDGE